MTIYASIEVSNDATADGDDRWRRQMKTTDAVAGEEK
jgi:hypothetical protein